MPDTYSPDNFAGYPGMVWYSRVTKTRGDQLQAGDALDSLDHCGARTIHAIRTGKAGFRQVAFSADGFTFYADGSSDSETVRDDVEYDVVDLASVCAPDGTPIR
ncbi:MAG TPA: hypothetical protein VI172_14885 [Candidatus Dormibacteraeota bacterium]|jgi:hypothetical protein